MKGEGEYNLNNLRQISVSDSYLGLDESVRECQQKEPLHQCRTRAYTKSISEKCGCVLLNFNDSATAGADEVIPTPQYSIWQWQ